jgi:hypothetical protein
MCTSGLPETGNQPQSGVDFAIFKALVAAKIKLARTALQRGLGR